MRKKLLYASFFLMLFQMSCREDSSPVINKYAFEYSGKELREWLKLECRITKETDGFFPPQAARAFGYAGITGYQAVYNGIPNAESLEGQIEGFDKGNLPQADPNQEYNWALAMNAAMADMFRALFEKKISAANLARIDSLETLQKNSLSNGVNTTTVERSIKYGKDLAAAIFSISKTDGGHEGYLNPFQTPYTPPAGDDKWVSTNPKFLTPLAPMWKSCRPFLRTNITYSQPTAPVAFSSDTTSIFFKAAKEVYVQVKTRNTAEEVEITKFWADDPFNTCTPTGHSYNILTQLLEDTRASLEKTAVAYGKMGVAENDAFIACWKTKYDYNLIRPVSYIKRYIDSNFSTVIGTPPFPAYTSGHATESGAAERILGNMFGNGGNYPFTDRTQMQFGFVPRNFNSFAQMAEECANSRYYGGIHYDFDNKKGLQMGRSIGDNTNAAINWPKNVK